MDLSVHENQLGGINADDKRIRERDVFYWEYFYYSK